MDSPFEHWNEWENNFETTGLPSELWSLEYFEIPRGRVLYERGRKRFVIYLDKTLLRKDAQDSIRKFFNISAASVAWRVDPHYTIDEKEIRQLFDTDN